MHDGVCGSVQTCDFTPPAFAAPLLRCASQLETTVSLSGVLGLSAGYSPIASREQVQQQMASLCMAYLKVSVLPIT